MLHVRRLADTDRTALERLRLSAPAHLGVSAASQTSTLRFLQDDFEYLEPNNERYVGIGVFDDAALISFMTALLEPTAWYVQLIMSSQTSRISRFNGIDICTDWMIAYAEHRGVRDFWYSIPLKYERVHRTAWRKSTKLLSRYNREDVLIIPKYTRCDDEHILHYLMSDMVLPVDMLIRHNSLPYTIPLYEHQPPAHP